MTVRLIDTHAHLDWKSFNDDREEMLQRARDAGVVGIISIGTNPETSRAAIRMAETYSPYVWAVVGLHPTELKADQSDYPELLPLLDQPRVVAIGEIGLDYHWDTTTPELQAELFRKQLALSAERDLPIVIHCREADDDCLSILKEQDRPIAGVVHCFGGTADHAREYLDLGMHISVGGPITFPKADDLREIAKTIPVERLLMETDSPFLAPQPRRGKRNEPAFVRFNAEKFSELFDLPLEELADVTTRNACRLFNLEVGK